MNTYTTAQNHGANYGVIDDESRFGDLLHKLGKNALSYLAWKGCSREDAQEIIQDVCLNIVKNYREKTGELEITKIFVRSVDNALISQRRKHATEKKHRVYINDKPAENDDGEERGFEMFLRYYSNGSENPTFDAVFQNQTQQCIISVFEKSGLSNQQTQMLIDIMAGHELTEIAKRYGIAKGTVQVHIARAKAKVREALGEGGRDYII